MPNDLEGLIIERAKWNHFSVMTLAILPWLFIMPSSTKRMGMIQQTE